MKRARNAGAASPRKRARAMPKPRIVPSLLKLAHLAAMDTVRSMPAKQFIASFSPAEYANDLDAQAAAAEMDRAAITAAKGRILGDDRKGVQRWNTGQRIDGAHFKWYTPATRTLGIRVKHSEIPGFWIDLELSMDQIQRFIEEDTSQA
jgi:hypothetical protein